MALFGKPGPTGPMGPAGPQGLAGEDGLQGDAGTAGEWPVGAVYMSVINTAPPLAGRWRLMESGEFSTTSPTTYLWVREA